jgi:hypothetical protein
MTFKNYIIKLRKRVIGGKKWLQNHKKNKRSKKYIKNWRKYNRFKTTLNESIYGYLSKHPEHLKELLKHEKGEPFYIHWAREQWNYRGKLVKEAEENIEDNLLIFYDKGGHSYITSE